MRYRTSKKIILIIILNIFLTVNDITAIEVLENYDVEKSEANYLRTFVEVTGIDLSIALTNRYIYDFTWARVNWTTLKDNWTSNWVWDEDQFLTNTFMHPYAGSLYYSAAKSNNLDFYTSALFTLYGSILWETSLETNKPSLNDSLATTLGGISLGEIFLRISKLFINEKSSGFERFTREFAALAIAPSYGFNRLIDGKSWQDGNKPNNVKYTARLNSGIRGTSSSPNVTTPKDFKLFSDFALRSGSLMFQFDFQYNDPFDNYRFSSPYDYFEIEFNLIFQKTNQILNFFTKGTLYAWSLSPTKKIKALLGFFLHNDFISHSLIKLSSSSVSIGAEHQFTLTNDLSINTKAHFGYIIIGSSDFIYSYSGIVVGGSVDPSGDYKTSRVYNLTYGANIKLFFQIKSKKFGSMYVRYRNYIFHTIEASAYEGAAGTDIVGILTAGIQINLNSKDAILIEHGQYHKEGFYTNSTLYPKFNLQLAGIAMLYSRRI